MPPGRNSLPAALAGLALFAAAAGLVPGCAGPQRRPEAFAPPEAAAPPAPPVPARPPVPGAREARPVRIRLDGIGTRVVLEGERIRVWTPDGKLLAEGGGSAVLAARGDRIAWGSARDFPSPADFGGPAGIRADGKRFPGRIRVTARQGKLQVVAVVPLEEYVAAVISREAPRTFAAAALEALAVAARTYALGAMAKPRDPAFDLVDGVEDQLFEGTENSDGPFRAAVGATRGMVLFDGGDALARAVYHSTCGGRTENAADAWGQDVPYLRSVACDDCRDSPAWRWAWRMSRSEGTRVAMALGIRGGQSLSLGVVGVTRTGRASRVRLTGGGVSRETSAASFRQAAGYGKVKSLKMTIVPAGGGWKISGEGYGHGVGMCQWGANGMAKRGKGFREILARYYPGTRVAGVER